MRLCIVGLGPSAKDRGAKIDACDFVVRLKAFWIHGAVRAGRKTSALAWYGGWGGWRTRPRRLECEHWMTHPPSRYETQGEVGQQCLRHLIKQAHMGVIRWVTEDLWWQLRKHIGHHPSTGFVAVGMAMAIHCPAELVLYGMDSTLPDRPHYEDARLKLSRAELEYPPHHMLREKQAIAEIGKGKWLGQSTQTRLIWSDRPALS